MPVDDEAPRASTFGFFPRGLFRLLRRAALDDFIPVDLFVRARAYDSWGLLFDVPRRFDYRLRRGRGHLGALVKVLEVVGAFDLVPACSVKPWFRWFLTLSIDYDQEGETILDYRREDRKKLASLEVTLVPFDMLTPSFKKSWSSPPRNVDSQLIAPFLHPTSLPIYYYAWRRNFHRYLNARYFSSSPCMHLL